MATVQSPRISCINWLDEGPLAPHVEAFKQYLIDRGYAASTFGNCLGSVAHFAQWLGRRRIRVRRIDETVVAEFLDEHLPSLPLHRAGAARSTQSAAPRWGICWWCCVLKARSPAPAVSTTPVDEELRRYDEHMDHVRGLAPKTRSDGAAHRAGGC